MPRNILAWDRCDICGRKGYVFKCRFQGRVLNLCPYCILVFSGRKGFSCGHRIVKLISKASYEDKWARVDLLASKLTTGLSSRKESVKSKKMYRGARRGRGQRK